MAKRGKPLIGTSPAYTVRLAASSSQEAETIKPFLIEYDGALEANLSAIQDQVPDESPSRFGNKKIDLPLRTLTIKMIRKGKAIAIARYRESSRNAPSVPDVLEITEGSMSMPWYTLEPTFAKTNSVGPPITLAKVTMKDIRKESNKLMRKYISGTDDRENSPIKRQTRHIPFMVFKLFQVRNYNPVTAEARDVIGTVNKHKETFGGMKFWKEQVLWSAPEVKARQTVNGPSFHITWEWHASLQGAWYRQHIDALNEIFYTRLYDVESWKSALRLVDSI